MPQLSLVTLTSNELLNLRTTPVQVLSAQGSGLYSVPFSVILRTHYNSNVYGNLTTSLGLIVNGVNMFPTQMSTAVLGANYDAFAYYTFASSIISPGLKVSDCDNQPIYIKNTGLLDLTGGDGTLDVMLSYEIINI